MRLATMTDYALRLLMYVAQQPRLRKSMACPKRI